MNDRYDPIIFYDALSPEEQEALREELTDDPDRMQALEMWQAVRVGLHDQLRERVPDRHVLVLYALEHGGQADLLTDEEQATLEAARPDLEWALEAHPGLADVVRRIQSEQADFEAVWKEQLGTTTETSSRRAPDRQPAARNTRSGGVRWRRWASRGAMVLAVVAFVALLALLAQRDQGMVTVTAPDDNTRLVDLGDGSTARLAGGATLTYPDPDEETVFARRATLEGRAFFDVVPQEEGFTVETPTAVATVLGTRFALEAHAETTMLVGVTGRVRLANRERESRRAVVVEGGQQSRVARNALPSTPTPVDVSQALDWTNLFLFHATPAQQIAERLSSFYEVNVTVASPLATEKVTGTFEQDRPVREVLQVLAATLQAEVQEQEGGYRLVPAA